MFRAGRRDSSPSAIFPNRPKTITDSSEEQVTSPSFCTTVNEKVYITTSSGKDAKGGSQGAVGDRRAALCGANTAGAGGL